MKVTKRKWIKLKSTWSYLQFSVHNSEEKRNPIILPNWITWNSKNSKPKKQLQKKKLKFQKEVTVFPKNWNDNLVHVIKHISLIAKILKSKPVIFSTINPAHK